VNVATRRICHVCNGHPADDGRVFHRTCAGLAKAGYEVHLFAVSNRTNVYSDQSVFVHPLQECHSPYKRIVRGSQIARMAADLNPDLFHVHEPGLLSSVLAAAGSRPVVYDVHESYLDIIDEREWIPRVVKPFARISWDKWERNLVSKCAGVVVVTERIARRYYKIHRNVAVIANYPDLNGIDNLPEVGRDGMTCVFAGLLTDHRGLFQTLEALAILKSRGIAVPLALAGRPAPEEYLQFLWHEADRLGVKELVSYHGILSKSESFLFQHKASIGLVPYQPIANCVASMANKITECMALGLPLVFSNFPNYRDVAGTSGAGIAVDSTKPEEIAHAIEYLVRNPEIARQMGEAGRQAVRERFNWNVEKKKLLDLYKGILGP
jgi:glycosyltransferase involved in cell wall biosynthesis